jgi:hypothetical protein
MCIGVLYWFKGIIVMLDKNSQYNSEEDTNATFRNMIEIYIKVKMQ